MSGTKHTPGPWMPVRLDIGSRSFWIAISGEGKLQETEENARLVAAAPQLLETLNLVAAKLRVYDHSDQAVLDAVRKAISMAEAPDE